MTESSVDRYLGDLTEELRDLPKARQRELVAEISEHIDSALAEIPAPGEADVRNVLEHLGEPADIAREERERLGIHPAKAGARETVTVILLAIGGVVLPLFGWIIALVLLWSSRVWTSRDKWIGTMFLPGGLLPAFILGLFPFRSGWVTLAMVLAVVVPIVTAIYLARRATTLSRG